MILILLQILLSSALDDDEACHQYVDGIIDDLKNQQIPQNISVQTSLYSGKGYNDLGSYLVCQDQANYSYFHLRLRTVVFPAHLGICLPNYCSQDSLQIYNQETTDAINQAMKTKLIVSSQYLDPELNYPEFGFGSYFACLVLASVIMLNIFSSGVSIYFKNKKQKHEQLHKDQSSYAKTVFEESDAIQSEQKIFMTGQQSTVMKEPTKFQEPKWTKITKCFSFVDNFDKLFHIEEPKGPNEGFVIFNGMRGLSIFWVIFGHEELIRGKVTTNYMDWKTITREAGWVTIGAAAYFAVDVFFFVGGFLAAVLVLDKLLKMKFVNASIVPSMWIHRFLRVWPTYAFCIIIYWKLTPYWSSGPIWNEYILETELCDNQWWRNMLFIDNMFDHDDKGLAYCYGWGWYLSVDFQVFMTIPIILFVYVKNKTAGIALMSAILFGSLFGGFLIAFLNNYRVNIVSFDAPPQPDYQDHFYYKPWVRASPYVIGVFYGLLYRSYQNKTNEYVVRAAEKIKQSAWVRVFMYVIGITITQYIIWCVAEVQKDMSAWSRTGQAVFQVLNRVGFVIGMALCITPALLNIKNDPTRWILGHPFWVPIARLSFSVYLVHFAIIEFMLYSQTQINYYQHNHILFFTICDIVYSLVIALFVSLMVEVPCMQLEKIIFAPPPKKGGATQVKDSDE